MGIFVTLNNVNRFPGLILRVKGTGDEIEIGYESFEEVGRTDSNGANEAHPKDMSVKAIVER